MNKTITLYFVRHGETLFNKLGRVQGWCDSPLTELGILQAKALGISLADIAFNKVYCSTSERAIDTANYIIGKRKIKIHYSKKLKEVNFGTMEGSLESDIINDLRERQLGKGWADIGGDDENLIKLRIEKGLNEIVENASNKDNILVVTHGAFLINVLKYITNKKILPSSNKHKHPIPNCSVSIINYDNGLFSIVKYGDTSYLEKGLTEMERMCEDCV
ncbi:MAG: histidine phosphatase family protein [Bacillota bacterium]|nr:histidine phosphatase family protein [Bacillota bacterium]